MTWTSILPGLLTTFTLIAACKIGGGDDSATDGATTGGATDGASVTSASSDPTTGASATSGATATSGDPPVACNLGAQLDGLPCATPGERCENGCNDDLCGACSWYECSDAHVWGFNEDAGGCVACDPNNLPPEGSACTSEGEFCGPGCENPCEFCNVMQCVDNHWTGLEVFPADCAPCEDTCPAVVAAACPGGPPDMTACVDGCNALFNSPCSLEFDKMRACIGSMSTFTCDDQGRPTVEMCAAQFAELYACTMP